MQHKHIFNPCQLTLDEQYPASYVFKENDAIKWLRDRGEKNECKES